MNVQSKPQAIDTSTWMTFTTRCAIYCIDGTGDYVDKAFAVQLAAERDAYRMALEEMQKSPKAQIATNTAEDWCEMLNTRAAAILSGLLADKGRV